MKKILFYFLLLSTFPAWSQNLHFIRGEIKNAGGKKVFLSGFYGEKVNRIDSMTCDASGHFIYYPGPSIQTGLYRLSTDKDHYLDIIINKENIEFTCNKELSADSTEFTSSIENKIYYYFLVYDRKIQSKLDLLLPLLDFYPEKDGFYLQASNEYERLQRSERKTIDSLSALYPGSYALRLFRLQQTPFLPRRIDQRR